MSKEFLSKLVHYRTYAKYLPEEFRRETREETIKRNMDMHIKKFPQLEEKISKAYEEVYAGRVVPSMRSFQFAGEPIERRPNRMYNCSFVNITSFKDFADLFYMSMSGAGVGFSVKKRHISQLPVINEGAVESPYIIEDSAEGWCDSLLKLFENPDVQFDYTKIRLMGSPLTTGGTASGPKALIKMHAHVRAILRKAVGKHLTAFECHRISCFVADCVVVGGVRRGALISLFDYDEQEMLHCKSGQWWEKYPELARANNSAVINKNDPAFLEKAGHVIQACFDGGQAEPGLSLTNEEDMGFNPCHEIALRSRGVCNLTEINAAKCFSKEEWLRAVEAATIIGTLQASYTDFKYVHSDWKKNAEEEALLGVSITGQAENQQILTAENLREGAELTVAVNREWAALIGIRPARRITTTKPSGTSSSWLGTTAGVHAGHEIRYIRRIRMDKFSALSKALAKRFPAFIVDDPFNPDDIIMQVPVKLYDTTLLRSQETAVQCLERVKKLYDNWIIPGHTEGNNTHNISLTINYHEHEKEAIKKWMLDNRDSYYGISLIPYDGGDYKYLPYSQPPHPEVYEILEKAFKLAADNFNFEDVKEKKDNTNFKGEAACAGGACSLQLD
jgi:ribonucleoside-triphosphate reductase